MQIASDRLRKNLHNRIKKNATIKEWFEGTWIVRVTLECVLLASGREWGFKSANLFNWVV